jgi:hypothetical protein
VSPVLVLWGPYARDLVAASAMEEHSGVLIVHGTAIAELTESRDVGVLDDSQISAAWEALDQRVAERALVAADQPPLAITTLVARIYWGTLSAAGAVSVLVALIMATSGLWVSVVVGVLTLIVCLVLLRLALARSIAMGWLIGEAGTLVLVVLLYALA